MDTSPIRSFSAGVLLANALPHAQAAMTGSTQMTPLRGRSSGPGANAIWAGANLVGSALVSRTTAPNSVIDRRWFRAGVLVFGAWVLASEWLTDLN